MYLLHRVPWLKDNQHILQLKAYLFFLKASSYSRGISPRFLSCQEREQDTNVRLEKVATAAIRGCLHGLELPSAKGPMAPIPPSLHQQTISAEEFQAQLMDPRTALASLSLNYILSNGVCAQAS